MNNTIRLTVAALIVGTLATTVTHAHGIWFAQRSGNLALIYGVGGSDGDMVKRLPTIKDIKAYDDKGQPVPTKLTPSGPMVLVDLTNNPSVVAAVMDYGFWSKTPDGKWHNRPKDEITDAVISRKSYKYAVHVHRELSAPLPPLPGQTLQIVPENLPALLGKRIERIADLNKPVKLTVLFQGKPVAGARVIVDWIGDPDAEGAMTDKAGNVTVKLRNHGLNVIHAIYESQPEDPKKSSVVEHAASLSFIVATMPE